MAAVPAPHGIAEVLPSVSREKAGLAPPRSLVLVSLDVYAASLVPGRLDGVALWKWQGLLRRVCRVRSVEPDSSTKEDEAGS